MSGAWTGAGSEPRAKLAAVDKSNGIIEFDLDGTILDANENFLSVIGYSIAEIKGWHYSLFVEPCYGAGPQYREF